MCVLLINCVFHQLPRLFICALIEAPSEEARTWARNKLQIVAERVWQSSGIRRMFVVIAMRWSARFAKSGLGCGNDSLNPVNPCFVIPARPEAIASLPAHSFIFLPLHNVLTTTNIGTQRRQHGRKWEPRAASAERNVPAGLKSQRVCV